MSDYNYFNQGRPSTANHTGNDSCNGWSFGAEWDYATVFMRAIAFPTHDPPDSIFNEALAHPSETFCASFDTVSDNFLNPYLTGTAQRSPPVPFVPSYSK